MPKYSIEMTATAIVGITLEIEAEDEEKARDLAFDKFDETDSFELEVLGVNNNKTIDSVDKIS